MALRLLKDRGVPIEKQVFTWKELVQAPYCKLTDDAFTRVRVILMNGIESEALRFSHACARMNADLQAPLARIRRIEQHQQTLVNWLNPPDQTPLETTIGFEQVAIEVTASVAQAEPDPYLAQTYRFGLLEDFDHLYRYSALMDRIEGKDANGLVQSYSDIVPGRPTVREHRHPLDDLRRPYDRRRAEAITKLNALTIMAGEHQTHDYYMTIGPMFADPIARQLYAEIASIEEQHVTHYESIIDPEETWLEKWLLHEAGEVYNYWSCVEFETNPRIKRIWERFLDYELGQLRFVADLFQEQEGRDAAEILPAALSEPIRYESHREFVRDVLRAEVSLSAVGSDYVDQSEETTETRAYRDQLNSDGSPSDTVAAGYIWMPGTELVTKTDNGRPPGRAPARKDRMMPADSTRPTNRTGVAAALHRAAQMITAVEEFPPTSEGNGRAIAAVRVQYAQEGADEGAENHPAVVEETPLLLDKLGERLAFERSGTRLYEALLSKHEAYGSFDGGPSRDDIAHILSEELQHFHMLAEFIKSLGGDPTELTPSANVQLTASHGVAQVLVDPRTNLVQSLEAIMMAELADNECWETLTGLARLAGHEELAERSEEALLTEQEHLEKVRAWLAAGQGRREVEDEGLVGEDLGKESNERESNRKQKSSRRR